MMALSVDDWRLNKNDTLMKSLKLVHSKPPETEQQNCHSELLNKNDTLMKSLKLVHSKPPETEQQNCHSTQSGNAE